MFQGLGYETQLFFFLSLHALLTNAVSFSLQHHHVTYGRISNCFLFGCRVCREGKVRRHANVIQAPSISTNKPDNDSHSAFVIDLLEVGQYLRVLLNKQIAATSSSSALSWPFARHFGFVYRQRLKLRKKLSSYTIHHRLFVR